MISEFLSDISELLERLGRLTLPFKRCAEVVQRINTLTDERRWKENELRSLPVRQPATRKNKATQTRLRAEINDTRKTVEELLAPCVSADTEFQKILADVKGALNNLPEDCPQQFQDIRCEVESLPLWINILTPITLRLGTTHRELFELKRALGNFLAQETGVIDQPGPPGIPAITPDVTASVPEPAVESIGQSALPAAYPSAYPANILGLDAQRLESGPRATGPTHPNETPSVPRIPAVSLDATKGGEDIHGLRQADEQSEQSDSEKKRERQAIYRSLAELYKGQRKKMTERILAKEANPKWNTRDPIALWKQLKERSGDDLRIRETIERLKKT